MVEAAQIAGFCKDCQRVDRPNSNLVRVYVSMLVLLALASVVRLIPALRVPVELPILAFTMALQGEEIDGFAGVHLQTIVVTNNLVKFCKALAGRYLNPDPDPAKIPSAEEVFIPGTCWLSYAGGAGIGGLLVAFAKFPLAVPMAIIATLAFIKIRAR